MKRRIAILGAVVVLLGCSAATVADERYFSSAKTYKSSHAPKAINLVLGNDESLTMIEKIREDSEIARKAEIARLEGLAKNKAVLEKRINQLSQHVNKTWYVFSGSTPRGWDCSGLVVWFYGGIGIEVPHSATKQGLMKPKVKDPVPGDIVVTKYINSKNFIHSGIYIGDNKMIHSGFKKGQRTEVIDLNDPSFKGQKHYFVRVIETVE